MATQEWPTADIPVKVLEDSYQDRVVSFEGEFQPDVGPPSRWPRSGAALLEVDFTLLADASERDALFDFYVDTCRDGTVPFRLADPVTDEVVTWYWREPPSTQPRVRREEFAANIRLQRFIGDFVRRIQLGAAFNAVGNLSGSVSTTPSLAALLDGVGDLAGAVVQTHRLAATIEATGDLVGDAGSFFDLGAAFDGVGDLSGDIQQAHQIGSVLSGSGDLAVDIKETFELGVELDGTGDLAGDIEEGSAGTTINTAINANADDDCDTQGFLLGDLGVTDPRAGHGDIGAGPDELVAGFRFTDIPPQGATILSATLTIEILNVSGSPDLNVHGVDADDIAAWSGSNFPSDTPQTTASTNITPGSTGSFPIDVTAQVQEIVNRGSFAENALALTIFDNAGSGENAIITEGLEAGDGNEATLDVTYS